MSTVPITLGRRERACAVGGFLVTECAYEPGTILPRHSHALACLAFPTSGGFCETIGAAPIDCEPYDVIVKPPAETHADRYGARGARCVLVEVEAPRLAALERASRVFERWNRLPRADARQLAQRLQRELRLRDDGWALAVESLVLELLVAGARRPPGGRPPRWLREAREFLDAHHARRPTLSEVAAAAGVHPASVARAFRAYLGCSPGEYARRRRVEAACADLARGEKSLSEIALASGFYDQSHFAAVFRRHVGVTPSAFRAAARRPS